MQNSLFMQEYKILIVCKYNDQMIQNSDKRIFPEELSQEEKTGKQKR